MPFDNVAYEGDVPVVGGVIKRRLASAHMIIAVAVGAAVMGIFIGYAMPHGSRFPSAAMAMPQPAKLIKTGCDLRTLPLGVSAAIVKAVCGEPLVTGHDDISGDQWRYGGERYAYIKGGFLQSWQWDGKDSFDSASVARLYVSPGELRLPPREAVVHETQDIWRDAAGRVIRQEGGTHPVTAWCHSEYRPR